MRCVLWGSLPVVLGLLLWSPCGASGPCWDSGKCQDLASEAGVSACAAACRAELSAEAPVYPGNGCPVAPPPRRQEEEGAGAEREEGKRSYSMEHFRWGKPVGRKRRPIKVYPNGVEEESAESYPMEMRRELGFGGARAPPREEKEEEEEEEEEEGREEEKAGGSYRMRHFRWQAPLKDKRYGGFMTSEHSQTPLVTLFKNAIVKSAYKKGQ
ncbi:PREDICTED: pro-opiomelanocortin [Mesitornis unicolor]|uniref:pro-opiomelanocortin n=1 Tax=Mesitornis unicolor TaxID=54374 RepID=UPI00052897D3|nr:PREDICTED: pro-opiomelanocortin [Mesitornis unicolor]